MAGKFYVPKEQKVTEPGQEQTLLHATVEELDRHDLALRENADDGRYLVFPSQFDRDYEDAPKPKGRAVAITFDGPVQSLYSTLAVRLGHSGLFTTGRAEMWRNAAVFTAKAGGKCGLFLHEFAEGRGRLVSTQRRKDATRESGLQFPRAAAPLRGHHCFEVRSWLPLRLRGFASLRYRRIPFRSKVEAMDQSADRQRDFDAFVVSAKGETHTKSFQD